MASCDTRSSCHSLFYSILYRCLLCFIFLVHLSSYTFSILQTIGRYIHQVYAFSYTLSTNTIDDRIKRIKTLEKYRELAVATLNRNSNANFCLNLKQSRLVVSDKENTGIFCPQRIRIKVKNWERL